MITADREQEFDAIVIGSGIGGLTTAALLSKLHHKKVLVLEQHFTIGGFTHSFERKGKFSWDVGIHYVGGMGKGNLGRAIFDYLSNGQLKWHKMPDLFEKFIYPDFTFDVSSDPKKYQTDLIQKFPQERLSIRRYFQDIEKAALWFAIHALVEIFPSWLQPLLRRIEGYLGQISRQTTQHYLDQNFKDPQLKALLVSQWTDYGLPPAQSCFGIHGVIVNHYLRGGWYPVGGGKAIAATIVPVIQQSGGVLMSQRRTTEILIESGTAVGVRVQHTAHPNVQEFYYAPIIISNAGAFNTYMRLVPQSFPLQHRSSIQAFSKGTSMLIVYLGLKANPQRLGFQGENHWIYQTYDHNAISHKTVCSPENPTEFCYLSFPSLKDPLAKTHTAELIIHTNYDNFSSWQGSTWRHRGQDYVELKAKIIESAVHFLERHYPGFKDLIEYVELSTPLTLEHFNESDQGAVYGIPCTPARFDCPWLTTKTPIKNLYLTGADTLSPGVMGAMMGGIKTAGMIDGVFGFFKVMATIMMSNDK